MPLLWIRFRALVINALRFSFQHIVNNLLLYLSQLPLNNGNFVPLKVGQMRNKLLKIFGIVLTVIIMSGVMTSCKSSHEICPAYTNLDNSKVNQF